MLHTGEAACAFLLDVIRDWNLAKGITCNTTENAPDMVKGVELRRRQLSTDVPGMHGATMFHVRCIEHVMNVAVKECMKLIHARISTIRSLINSIRANVKRRDLFDMVRAEMNCKTELPKLDTETLWSSTFAL